MRIFAPMDESKIRILVVDDEKDICDILCYNLRAAGYDAMAEHSAEQALARNDLDSFHLLLVDVMMGGMSGFKMAEQLRKDRDIAKLPIVFITAKDSEDDTLRGFSLGADDYIAKPFSVREVMARVKAVLQRTRPAKPHQLRHGCLCLDTQAKTLHVDGHDSACTPTEYELMLLLMSHAGQVYSREQLIAEVWPEGVIVTERTVDVNIARLRKKLGEHAACIANRVGYGYYFNAET